jgi:hypothetical protein
MLGGRDWRWVRRVGTAGLIGGLHLRNASSWVRRKSSRSDMTAVCRCRYEIGRGCRPRLYTAVDEVVNHVQERDSTCKSCVK